MYTIKKITMSRRLILAALAAMLAIIMNAQTQLTTETPVENKAMQYCDIVFDPNYHRAWLDYGFKDAVHPTDAEGEEIKFNSEIAILNYMTLQGWQYCGNSGSHLLFRKEVTHEEAAQLIEKMKREKKKK